MTTLIAVYNSEGLVGRCDAKCYNAEHPDCNCVCGGANHGAGFDRALSNTQEMAREWVEEYTKARSLESWWSEVATPESLKRREARQLMLPGL